MKKILLAASLFLLGCASLSSQKAEAQTPPCSGGAISGLILGRNPANTACNYATVNDDGSINTSGGGGSGGNVNQTGINGVTPSVGAGLSDTGTQRVDEAAAAPLSSAALAANQVVCSAACQLTSFDVSADATLSGAAWWIMIYNLTAAPADGAVTPTKCYAMPSGYTTYAAAFPIPLNMTTGAVIGVSTNGCFTKAASTHAFISGDKR